MNTLAKCIDELKKEQPDIRYILGMLETYLELSGTKLVYINGSDSEILSRNRVNVPGIVADEEKDSFTRMYEKGPIGNINS